MKKMVVLILALAIILTLAACGGNTDAPSGGDTQPPSQAGTSVPAITTGSGEASVTIDGEEYVGNYEGEYADGLFSGYGVWEFENWRYEGYWENGMPNGKGLLTESWDNNAWYDDVPDVLEEGVLYSTAATYEGIFVDALPDGDVVVSVYTTPPEARQGACEVCIATINTHGEIPPIIDCPVCGLEGAIPGPAGVPPWDDWYREQKQSSDTPQTQSTGGDTQDTTAPTPGANVQDIPDNGTPPTVEPPLESHVGDKAYFYTTTDNYIVYVTDGSENLDLSNSGLEVQVYILWCFDTDGYCEDISHKYVFSSNDDAGAFMAQISNDDPDYQYIQIDNVVYIDSQIPPAAASKRSVIDDINENQYEHYISMP